MEQITFCVGFLAHLVNFKPDIIWLQEGILGEKLIFFRKILGLNFKIIFCDGAPVGPAFVSKFDHIVFLNQKAMNDAIKYGIEESRCHMIPLLTMLPSKIIHYDIAKKRLNINSENFVIICVAAWNTQHKRIDYLLNEIKNLSDKHITLMLCGQEEADFRNLKQIADEIPNVDIRWYTLSHDDLSIAYFASDLFVLASINEGLGLVLIEAAMHYLPVICHKHNAGQLIFGSDYFGFADLAKNGNLSKKILELKSRNDFEDLGNITNGIVKLHLDRNSLILKFVNLIKSI